MRGGNAVALAAVGRQQVVVAVVIDHLLGGRTLLEELLDVRQLVHMLGEIQEAVRVLGNIVQIEQRQADIWEVAGHHLGGLLLAPSVVGDLLPFDVAIAGGLKLLGERHVLDLDIGHVTADGDVHDRLAIVGSGRMIISPTRCQRHHHGRRCDRGHGKLYSTKTAVSHNSLLTTCDCCLFLADEEAPTAGCALGGSELHCLPADCEYRTAIVCRQTFAFGVSNSRQTIVSKLLRTLPNGRCPTRTVPDYRIPRTRD